MKQKVVVGLSGGVDSSVAACLLKEQGYEVLGITLRTRKARAGSGLTESESCNRECAVEDAGRVAGELGIPFEVVDYTVPFQKHVIDYFVEEYLKGHTPNPCIACNRYVKWEALLSYAESVGAEFIATGHYARVLKLDNGRYTVANAAASAKDQTYALYNLTQEQLSRTLFPVGEFPKEKVREMAEKAALPVAHKPDSQEICFVPDDNYAGFIEREAAGRVPGPGNFVTPDGTVLGRHRGITHYTVGQRKGLELAMGRRVFVTEIRPDTNEVVIGEAENVLIGQVCCDRMNYMATAELEEPRRVFAKVRYNHKGEYGVIEKQADGSVVCTFEKPVRASAPGQAVVFYENGYVLGGGTIL